MQLSKQHYLRLVWPPQEVEVEDVDSLCMLRLALLAEGWRSVLQEDIATLPANSYLALKVVIIDGKSTIWIQNALEPASCKP